VEQYLKMKAFNNILSSGRSLCGCQIEGMVGGLLVCYPDEAGVVFGNKVMLAI